MKILENESDFLFRTRSWPETNVAVTGVSLQPSYSVLHMSSSPSWPSLYNPGLELKRIDHNDAIQQGAHYLYRPGGEQNILNTCESIYRSHTIFSEIFRFTLYWTLIFHLPLFILCGTYAFFNLSFPPSRDPPKSTQPLSSHVPSPQPRLTPPRANEGRSRLAFAILVLLVFLTLSLMNAVIGAAVVGYILAGLYDAAKFNMSTCVECYLFHAATI